MFTAVRHSSVPVVRLQRASTADLWLAEVLILYGSAEQFNKLQIKSILSERANRIRKDVKDGSSEFVLNAFI
jgi:hypothetical protein